MNEPDPYRQARLTMLVAFALVCLLIAIGAGFVAWVA